MDAGWYALSDGSKKYWNGSQWLEAQPLGASAGDVAAPQEPQLPPPPTPLPAAQARVAGSPAGTGSRSRVFALVAVALFGVNAFFPVGLLEDVRWAWERLSYLTPVELIAPWYVGSRFGVVEMLLWWIGIILAVIFTSLRIRAGALAGVIVAAVPSLLGVVTYVTRFADYGISDWSFKSQVFFIIDLISVVLLVALAITMVARLTPRPAETAQARSASGNPDRTNPLAVAAMVSSILTFWIVGIVLGHIALRQIRRTGEGGRGMALAGVIVGYVGWALGLVLLVVFYQWWYNF